MVTFYRLLVLEGCTIPNALYVLIVSLRLEKMTPTHYWAVERFCGKLKLEHSEIEFLFVLLFLFRTSVLYTITCLPCTKINCSNTLPHIHISDVRVCCISITRKSIVGHRINFIILYACVNKTNVFQKMKVWRRYFTCTDTYYTFICVVLHCTLICTLLRSKVNPLRLYVYILLKHAPWVKTAFFCPTVLLTIYVIFF